MAQRLRSVPAVPYDWIGVGAVAYGGSVLARWSLIERNAKSTKLDNAGKQQTHEGRFA